MILLVQPSSICPHTNLNEDTKEHEILDESPMEVTSYTSTSVDATITASTDGRVVTTIPYDTGWTVTVDGNTVDMSQPLRHSSPSEFLKVHTIHLDYTQMVFISVLQARLSVLFY